VRLTNRQLAAHLGVALSGVARAAERRGINRDAQGYYLVTDQVLGDGVKVKPFTLGETQAPAPSQPVKQYEPVHLNGERKPSSFKRVCFVSDIHVPEHDAFAVRAWLKWAKANQPDMIILGGDILELESCSGHGGNIHSAPLFTSEIEAGNAFLDDVQAACPNAEIVYLEGNHETRLHRKVDLMTPTLAGALHLPDLLRLSERGISWHNYGSVFFAFGSKLGATHGTKANDHHAKAHLAAYGSSIVYGHTHRPQLYVQGYANNRLRGAFGAPCLRSLDVSWIKGPTGWAQGFVVAHVFEDGHFTAYPILMDGQRFVEGGVLYDGRA
jgi:predicted phosphodiesterase